MASDSSSLLLRLIFGNASSSSSSSSDSDALVIRKRLQITIISAAAISSLATAAGIFGYQHIIRASRRHNLERNARSAALDKKGKGKANGADKQNIPLEGPDGTEAVDSPKYLTSLPDSLPGPDAYRSSYGRNSRKAPKKWDETLLREQLARNYSFLGEEGMEKLRKSSVTVVGAGGVGSWAALMLLRSGVGKIRIIDFDQVSLSSLNRHACATLADVGRPKVLCCADYFAKIAPWIEVEPIVDVFKAETAQDLLSGNPTWIIDAIDNIDAKVLLLKSCYEQNLRVFASMGAGGKADPSRVQICDISDTYEDPLAASVRRRLRMHGIPPIPPKEAHWLQKPNKEPKKAAKKSGKAATNGKLRAEPESSITRSSTMATITPKDVNPAPIPERSSSVQSSSANGILPEQQPSTSSRPAPSTTTPERRRRSFTHARRSSSSSSLGSGVYSTPLSTPTLEADDQLQDDTVVPPLEDVAERTEAGSDTPHSQSETPADEILPPPSYETVDHKLSQSPVQSPVNGELEEMEPASEADKLRTTSVAEEGDIGHGAAFHAARGAYHIPCVYSTEKSDVTLLPLPEEEFQRGQVNELSPLEQFRVRILPVLGPLPAIFGLAAATYIICDIAGHPMEPLPFKRRRKLYEKIHGDLEHCEKRHPVGKGPLASQRLPFKVNDIAFIFEEIFSGKSVVPPHESLVHANLLRWDSTLPLSYSNVALFSRSQAKIHEKEVLQNGNSPWATWGEGTAQRMRQCQARERYMREIREM